MIIVLQVHIFYGKYLALNNINIYIKSIRMIEMRNRNFEHLNIYHF